MSGRYTTAGSVRGGCGSARVTFVPFAPLGAVSRDLGVFAGLDTAMRIARAETAAKHAITEPTLGRTLVFVGLLGVAIVGWE